MERKLIVNCDSKLTRVALLEEGKAAEVYVERPLQQRLVGNIYKGVVANVLPGMQAAFIDIGLDRNAFLYVDDIPDAQRKGKRSHSTIQQLLRPGDKVLVQVEKEPFGTKGARLTGYITLPGRYLVLMPGADYIGISRKIADENERERLKSILEDIKPQGMGIIARTAAEGAEAQYLKRDVSFLVRQWHRVRQRFNSRKAPSLLHQDAGLLYRILRDLFNETIDEMLVDTDEEYHRVLEVVEDFDPELKKRVTFYTHRDPIFEHYGIETEIRRALQRIVWLKSGGYIVFDYTEALTVVDVNTGKYIGKSNLSETVLKTNLEAAEEIIRQIRMRDIGGIIIIDFIDMVEDNHRRQVMQLLDSLVQRDRTLTHILGLTSLGLVEMTRKKVRQGLISVYQEPCPNCGGEGRVLKADVVSVRVEKQIIDLLRAEKEKAVLMELNPEIAALLIGTGGQNLQRLEAETNKHIFLRGAEDLSREALRVVFAGTLAEVERLALPVAVGGRYLLRVEEPHNNNPYNGIARVSGFVINITGGAAYVGQEVEVEITEIGRTWARGKINFVSN